MITRRKYAQTLALLAGGFALRSVEGVVAKNAWVMPDESAPHQRTWMAFGASKKIWGSFLLPEAQRNLALIATTIAKYEPVSMLVRKGDLALAKKLMGTAVELIVCPLDDLWLRDTGPVFVHMAAGAKGAIDFNFNGWGEKQEHDYDAFVASFIIAKAGITGLQTDLVLEGGGIEVNGAVFAVNNFFGGHGLFLPRLAKDALNQALASIKPLAKVASVAG